MGGHAGMLVLSNLEMTKSIRKNCRNKCKIEASIAEAYILEEVLNFTTAYYGDKLTSMHNPPRRYNDGGNESNLRHEDCRYIMLYVLTNLEENSSVHQGTQLHRNMIPYLERVLEMDCPISFPSSNIRYVISL
jgi:hypothetical protein